MAGRKIAHAYHVLNQPPVLASHEITHEAVLHKTDAETQIAFLMEFFEKSNRDSGVPRPKGLYGRG
jgi:hypothetical protein